MDGIAADPAADHEPAIGGGGGEDGVSPVDVAGYTARFERLLTLARARQLDLASLSLPDLVEQLSVALQHASGRTALGLQGDWVVTAAWLLLLRSRLLLPADATAQEAAGGEAAQLRRGLLKLQKTQAAARWLEARPQLGRDVFPRGEPELVGVATTTAHQVDVIEFLWASLALFDDDLPDPDTSARYRPAWPDLHTVADASARISRRLAEDPATRRLDQLLPDQPGSDAPPDGALRRRSGWTSSFVASLELARQGAVWLDQERPFSTIHVSRFTECLAGVT